MTARPPAQSGWFLYDAECAFCVQWARRFEPILRKNGFVLEPLQSAWVAQALQMKLDELLHDVRLLTVEGKLISGADVYLFAARKVWWARPFAWLFALPGLHHLAEAGYRQVARSRYCISGKCQVPIPPGGLR
jgi:predicted DCC family thiol-disulfide oxidoreductase YuxK